MPLTAAAGVTFVETSGSYIQMGAECGELTAPAVERNLASYLHRFHDEAALTMTDVRNLGRGYLTAISSYSQPITDLLTGLAEGAGQPVELIAALNARTELLYSSPAEDQGCTALAVLPSYARDGAPMLAMNWDWEAEQAETALLWLSCDDDGNSVLTLTEAGMLAKTGVSSSGIGIVLNLLGSDRDRGFDGVPFHILLRGVLHSATMADAIAAVIGQRRNCSGNVILADAGGEAIDLELAGGDFAHLLPTDGLLAHANHFESHLAVEDRHRSISPLTLLRPSRVRHLLAPRLDSRNVSLEDIQTVLRDHYSYPHSICRHQGLLAGTPATACSLYSVVIEPSAGRLHVATHPPCSNDFVTFDLNGRTPVVEHLDASTRV